MQIEKDAAEIRGGVRGGETLGSPDRALDREPRLRQLGGDDGARSRSTRARPSCGGCKAPAARPRRPRRRHQVPAPRPARHPRARLGARDHGPGRRRRLRPDAARRARRRDPQRRPLARADRRRRARRRPGRTSCRSTSASPLRAIDRELEPEMVAPRRAGQGRGRHARRRGDGDRPRRAGRARLARAVGREARRPARPGDDVGAGGQGGRDRRARSRRPRLRQRRPRRHRAPPTEAAGTGRPTAPAASRAASPTARTWW